MGIFDFIKNAGRDVDGDTASAIQQDLEKALPGQIENLGVNVDGSTAVLKGRAVSRIARENAILRAGNVKGIEKVDDDGLTAPAPQPTAQAAGASPSDPEPTFYTVQEGDSLSKIAESEYGDANKWEQLFEANKQVIEDPDLIYPGQKIRVPELG